MDENHHKILQYVQELKDMNHVIKTLSLHCESLYANQKYNNNSSKNELKDVLNKTHSQVCGLVHDTCSIVYDIGKCLNTIMSEEMNKIGEMKLESRILLLRSRYNFLNEEVKKIDTVYSQVLERTVKRKVIKLEAKKILGRPNRRLDLGFEFRTTVSSTGTVNYVNPSQPTSQQYGSIIDAYLPTPTWVPGREAITSFLSTPAMNAPTSTTSPFPFVPSALMSPAGPITQPNCLLRTGTPPAMSTTAGNTPAIHSSASTVAPQLYSSIQTYPQYSLPSPSSFTGYGHQGHTPVPNHKNHQYNTMNSSNTYNTQYISNNHNDNNTNNLNNNNLNMNNNHNITSDTPSIAHGPKADEDSLYSEFTYHEIPMANDQQKTVNNASMREKRAQLHNALNYKKPQAQTSTSNYNKITATMQPMQNSQSKSSIDTESSNPPYPQDNYRKG